MDTPNVPDRQLHSHGGCDEPGWARPVRPGLAPSPTVGVPVATSSVRKASCAPAKSWPWWWRPGADVDGQRTARSDLAAARPARAARRGIGTRPGAHSVT